MNTLEKIIFVADFIEPGRKFPEAQKIRRGLLSKLDLNQAVRAKALTSLGFAKKQKWTVADSLLKLAKEK